MHWKPRRAALFALLLPLTLSATQPTLSFATPEAGAGRAILPSLPQPVAAVVAAYGGPENMRAHHDEPLVCRCTISSSSGISSAANNYDCKILQKAGKLRVEMTLLGAPLTNVYDGRRSWTQFGDWVTAGTPSATKHMADELDHGLSGLIDVLDPTTKIEVLPRQMINGVPCDVFKISTPSGKTDTYFADAKTHLIQRCEYTATDHELGTRVKHAVEYFDYRPVSASIEPFKLVQYTGDKRKAETTIQSITSDPTLDDSAFAMPPESRIARLQEGPISLPFDYVGNSIVIKARVNNGPEQEFIVDTGASQTVLDAATAAGLGPQSQGKFSITAGSKAVPLSYVNIPSITISGITFDDVPALVTDLSNMNGHPAGIIGASILKRFKLTIDFEEKRLILADPHSTGVPQGATVLHATPVFGGTTIMVKGMLDEKPVNFLVDTGASFNNLPPNVAKNMYSGNVLPTGEIYGIDGHRVNIGSVKFKSLRLGDLVIPNPVFTLSPDGAGATGGLFNANGMGILGNPIWSQFRLTIDYRNERLILESDGGRDEFNKLSQQLDRTSDDYLRHKDAEQALKSYEDIAAAAHKGGQKGAEALAMARIADCHADKYTDSKDSHWLDQSSHEYEQANKLANESRNRMIEGRILAQWALTCLASPRHAGDINSAQALLAKALQKAPMDANIFAAFGTALLQQGKKAEADKLLDRALVLDPANWQALWAKYKLYGDENRVHEQNQIGAQLRHYYAGYPDVTALGPVSK